MISISASYGYYNPNFVIQNMDEPQEWAHPVFAIMKNLLMRGCPTIPSALLREKFGEIERQYSFKYCRTYDNLAWNRVIKGGDINNPAYEFYTNILSKFEPLGNTFIPEFPVCDIIPELKKNRDYEKYGQVDFYSPAYNMVIEIDGAQHKDTDQNAKDVMRDQIFETYDVKVLRITTDMLNNHDVIYNILSSNLCINMEKNVYCHDKNKIYDEEEIPYMIAMRLQVLLTYLYGNKTLSLDEGVNISLHCDFDVSADDIYTIFDDYYLWIKNLFELYNVEFNAPQINLTICNNNIDFSNASGIKIDLSLQQVYAQVDQDDVYYIRNDYFNFQNKYVKIIDNNSSKLYLGRNYFRVECVPVSYNLSIDKHAENLRFILRNISNCGYNDYRANQLDIIIELLNNRCAIGILPTGAGKSLCYQIASILIPSMTIVVSPLQLLMIDQYEHLCSNFGMNNATYINATHTDNLYMFEHEQSIVTYVSPERFFNRKFSNYFDREKGNYKVGFIVIDEAHCLSEWGHDFRTSYLCLSHNLSNILPASTFVMALTGTASHSVFKDIENELCFFTQKPIKSIFAEDMRRDNLSINIERYPDLSSMFKDLTYNILPTIKGVDDNKTIVFTKTVQNMYNNTASACIPLYYNFLDRYKTNNLYYFASELSEQEKQHVLQSFKSENGIKILFATKAFGMGIDINDIRKTIHYGLPSSMESLYQQIGRAGRDGKRSLCYVYFVEEQKSVYNEFFADRDLSIEDISEHRGALKELGTNFYFLESSNLDTATEKNAIWKLCHIIKDLNSHNAESLDCMTIAQELARSIKDEHLVKVLGGKIIEKTYYDTDKKEKKNVKEVILDKLSNSASIIIEKALYRLFLLGEINMWNVVYSTDVMNPIYIHLRCTKYTEEEKYNMLVGHIEKYESRAKAMPSENTFLARLDKLVEWSYNTFFIERVKSMKTLYDWCYDFVDSNNFMNKMSNYFSNEPVYVRLVDKAVDIDDIDKALVRKPEDTKLRIARLLESYENMYALNYVSGITRLRLDEYDEFDGERRLGMSLEYIKDFDEKTRHELFNITCEYLLEAQIETFVDTWLKYIANDVYWIYDMTSSESAEQYIIVNSIDRILRIKEKIDDRLQ